MKISCNFPSFRDLNFEKITKPVGNLISSLYKKGAPYLPSPSTDTRLYKNPYVLTAVTALVLSVFVIRRFFPNNVSPFPENPVPVPSKTSNLEKEFQTACTDIGLFSIFVKTYLQGEQGWTVTDEATNVKFVVNASYLSDGSNKNAHIPFKLTLLSTKHEVRIDYTHQKDFNFPFYKQENLCTSEEVQDFVKALIVSRSYKHKDFTYSLVTV